MPTTWDALLTNRDEEHHALSEARVRRWIGRGKLSPGDFLRKSGSIDWTPMELVAEFRDEEALGTQSVDLEPEPAEPKAPASATSGPVETEPPADAGDQPTAGLVPLPGGDGSGEAKTEVAGESVPLEETRTPPPPVPRRQPDPRRLGAPPARSRKKEDDDEPTGFLARQRPEEEELDLTPMVDVTFLLVLFFMVTASYTLQDSIPVPVPEQKDDVAQAQTEEPEQTSVLVDIESDNRVFINDTETSINEVAEIVRLEMRNTGNNEVLIRASRDAQSGPFVAVVDAVKGVSPERVQFQELPRSSGSLP